MRDHLIRATTPGIRAFAAVTTELVEEARRRHDCYPVASAALGRTMTAALMLAANLKTEETLTLRIEGDGPLGTVVTDANSRGAVRGYVKNPQIHLPLREGKLDVGKAVGSGTITLTRFTGLKQPFSGSAPLLTGEIGEDVANYLLLSEQTPSTVAVGVLVQPDLTVTAAGGLLVQAMPGADDKTVAAVEENLARLPAVSQLVTEGYDGAAMLEKVFAGLPVNLYDSYPLAFNCPCSKEKVENVLISLGKSELEDIILDGQAELICHFCNQKYIFERAELEDLLKRLDNK
ncbi:heat shock protein hsp33 [Lucifera butyrica]|uniref:33 kDa chaperonin n=1 Tax=Lucifera butyrica TaxID=1351585 RepID=A0A498R9U3_9FIRM|nr:Hsp33 family molecular chaperone HslO [Lucifera butyrica]VBB07929.1 heat shock protein hsp33 [Lucifera butyrica]